MRRLRIGLLLGAMALFSGLYVQPALAQGQVAGASPGNYCVGCHTPGDESLDLAMTWRGGIDSQDLNPCPALIQIQEEMYYTERLLLANERLMARMPGGVDLTKTGARLAATTQTYSRLIDAPVTSLDAFSSDAQLLRFRMGKIHSQLDQLEESAKRLRVLIAAVAVSLVVLGSLVWGWWNARAALRSRPSLPDSTRHAPGFRFYAASALFLVLVLVLFALPIFRVPSQDVASASAGELARQAALDTAGRYAAAVDRSLARAWILAKVGAQWEQFDPGEGEPVLQDALSAIQEVQLDQAVIWGQAQTAKEVALGDEIALDKSRLVMDQLQATQSRAWELRLIALEWAGLDPDLAGQILERAFTIATNGEGGIYRDLDLRALAVIWSQLDLERALQVVSFISDPGLRSWGLREIAQSTSHPELYDQAAEAAHQVSDPVQRSRLLARIGVLNGDRDLFVEALQALAGVEGVSKAYALADLAAASGDAQLAQSIDPAYPEARTLALLHTGLYKEAWLAAEGIFDPYDRARAQAEIAAQKVDQAAALQIAIPVLRDKALREIAIKTSDTGVAGEIESSYYRLQTLVALGDLQAALGIAPDLEDTRPLQDLAIQFAATDPQTALALVEKMQNEVEKAAVLRTLAERTHDPDIFERALGMALAARVRGDALAPVEASLDLAQSFYDLDNDKAQAALAQALEAAQRISTQ